ncbi:MAG: PAS domain S-box protein [Candidatus Zixiibacteriota bacterium]
MTASKPDSDSPRRDHAGGRAGPSWHPSPNVVPSAARQLLDSLRGIDDMVYFLGFDGRTCGFNPASGELTGYSLDELESDPGFLGHLIHPDDLSALRDLHTDRQPSIEIDYRLKGRDGSYRWVHSHQIGVRDEDGMLSGYICLDRDVSEQKAVQAAVQVERDRTLEYINIAGVILVALDTQGRVTMINRMGRQILGYEESEIIGAGWFEHFLPASERQRTRRAFDQLMAGELSLAERFNNPVLTKDGRERLISWRNMILRDKSGNITGTLSSGEDITDRRRAERALEQSEAQFRALFEGTSSCIVFIKDRIIKYANAAALRMFGYTREEMIGRDTMIVHTSPESYEQGNRIVYESVRQNGTWQGEWLLKRKDGSRVWMDTYVTAMPDGGTVVILHDITDRVQVKAALSEREAELTAIFRAAPVGIGLTVDRVLKQANEKLCAMLGYTPEELIGQSARILYPTDEEFEYVGRVKYDMIHEKGTGTVETRWKRKDGTVIDILLSSTPVDPADWSKGITFTALDITERKKSEQALLDKNVALREILNQISADREAIREQIATNIGETVLPMLKRIEEKASPSQLPLVAQLEKDFKQISAPFLDLLKKRQPALTPRETEICRLIKNGMTSKQIAEALNVSLGTVHKYRELIRRKLGLANVDINLTSYLQSL